MKITVDVRINTGRMWEVAMFYFQTSFQEISQNSYWKH
jgi:hypothetical protein